jgi:hypothetical protein
MAELPDEMPEEWVGSFEADLLNRDKWRLGRQTRKVLRASMRQQYARMLKRRDVTQPLAEFLDCARYMCLVRASERRRDVQWRRVHYGEA